MPSGVSGAKRSSRALRVHRRTEAADPVARHDLVRGGAQGRWAYGGRQQEVNPPAALIVLDAVELAQEHNSRHDRPS